MNHYDNIVLSKGTYSITLFTNDASESGDNKLIVIPIPTTKTNQSSGQKETKVVDLLRITNTLHIVGYISNLGGVDANTIKQNLITLFKGAGTTGGAITLTYDNVSYSVFIQKWIIQKLHVPISITTSTTDVAYYTVTLDFVVGTEA
jgi:hypothetical protein